MSRKAPDKGSGVSSKFDHFYDPKQTRADRAKVRATHRDISDLIEKEKDVLTNQVLEEAKIFDEENGYRKTVFHKIKGKIEENYENVNRTREGVGDLRNLQDLTKTSFLASRSLVESNKHVNPDAIIQGIKLRYAIDASELNSVRDFRKSAIEIDWVKLGREAAVYCRAPPRWMPMVGKVGTFTTSKVRKQAKKYQRENEKPKFKEEKNKNENTDEQNFQLKLCREMLEVVERKCMLDEEVKKYKQTGSGVCNFRQLIL